MQSPGRLCIAAGPGGLQGSPEPALELASPGTATQVMLGLPAECGWLCMTQGLGETRGPPTAALGLWCRMDPVRSASRFCSMKACLRFNVSAPAHLLGEIMLC